MRNERGSARERGRKGGHAGTFPISGSWAAALQSPIVAIMTGDATAAATTWSRATTSTSTKATTTTTTAATTNTTTTRTTTTTGHKLTAVCWCLRLPSLPMFYASAYKYTPIHTQTLTDTHSQIHRHVHFSIFFFPSSLVTNLATSCSFLIYLQRQAVNSFVVALCLDPQSFSPLFISLYPRDCYSELKANPNPSPLPSQSVSFSQCHRAVKSSQRSLSENFLITTSRSLRVLLHSVPPSLAFHLSLLDLFMENFFL